MTTAPDQKKLVSVIMPAYRAAAVITETIQSVIAQTHMDWELLITDDCSPDDTCNVVREWAQIDPRVKLNSLPKNSGPAAARNASLGLARGRWIAFLDSDDQWLPNKLERSLTHAIVHRAALTFTGYHRISSDSRTVGKAIHVPKTLSYRQLLGNTAIATSTVVLDRNVVGDIRMRETYYDDFDCWLGILKRGHLAYGLDEDLMRYRMMAQSVSRNKHQSARHVWHAYRNLEQLGVLSSAFYFSQYAFRGALKYLRF